MSILHIGLVDATGYVNPELVQAAAMALNIQVLRDLPQFWDVQATVMYLPDPQRIPVGVWPVLLVASLPPGEGGFHLDQQNQPYAKVLANPANDSWTIAASHEILEMLVDPYGNRLQPARSIQVIGGRIEDGPGEFDYLVEICDPCEHDLFAYGIRGIAVSDFITPRYYDPMTSLGVRYSFTGSIQAPRQVLPGGYISWIDPFCDELHQLQFVDTTLPPHVVRLGGPNNRSLREGVHAANSSAYSLRNTHAMMPIPQNPNLHEACRVRRMALDHIARRRGARLI